MGKNRELIKKFRDYADIADASYAMLHWVFENEENEIYDNLLGMNRWHFADNIALSDKTTENDRYLLNNEKIGANKNTAYARCIEARFMQDVVFKKGTFFDDKIDNDPKNIPLNATLSLRTITFTNRYELLAHQPNTKYGFSATLFEDKGELIDKATNTRKVVLKDSKYILVFRGTEIGADDISIDIVLATNGIPMQCYEVARFYEKQVKPKIKNSKLIVVGHSLGGYLAQSFCFMYPERVAELYTYNAPGLLGAWNKTLAQILRDGAETALMVGGVSAIIKNIAKITITKYVGYSFLISIGVISLKVKITYEDLIPKELQEYKGIINYLIKNIKDAEDRDGVYMPYPLNKNNHYHIEATDRLDFKSHMSNTSYYVNLIQHLGTDIAGNYYPIYLGFNGLDSHFLAPMLKTLYFYSYLLELDSNLTFFESNLDKTIQSLNSVVTSIVKILYHTDSYNKKRDEAIRTANDNSFDLDPPSNHIYATIDKTLFEATLKTTNKDKFSIDEKTLSNMIDGILYLQDNNIFLKLLSKDNMQQADKNTNLAILLAIHENLFFISVDTANNKEAILIKDKDSIVQLLKHNATRTQIFCYNLEHIDDGVIKGYANEALKYYPQFKEAQ
ncbi:MULTISPECIES: alpha/beta hydrolase [Helicobacter]|uniref:alpha/beta hydrolase n=1 Tax=Helicobacter TaxID=209 RepID=UPI0001A28839|nr:MULTISPECIES: alpha/beta hydrolase [Helicobacter]